MGHTAEPGQVTPSSELAAYSLTAAAIAGRHLTVCGGLAGSRAFTNGTSIFVPPECPPSLRFDLVVLHASLIGAGSVAPEVVRRLRGQARTTRRYFALESTRARRTLDGVMPCRALGFESVPVMTSSAAESLAVARSGRRIPELAPVWGEFRPKSIGDRSPAAPAGESSSATPVGTPEEAEKDQDEEETERSRFLELFSSPLGGNSWLSRLFSTLAGAEQKSTSASGSTVDQRQSRHVLGRGLRGHGIGVSATVAALRYSAGQRAGDGVHYPEWDSHRRSFREDWCTVRERTVASGPETVGESALLRYPLGRSRLDLRRSRRETLGDEVDVDAVIEARSDARSGHTPDDRIYSSLRRLRRDLGVLILLDSSGSTADPAGSNGSVLDVQAGAAARLAHTLDSRGDRVAIYGFNSRGRSDVYLHTVKEFRQGFDFGWPARLAHLRPAGFTRMGAAIRHGVTILTTRSGAAREILLVLSDGIPYDEGYEGGYAISDTRRALNDAREAGVGCLCLSLGGQQTASELERVFGAAAFARADDIADIGRELNVLFNHALFAAERAQRRRATNAGPEPAPVKVSRL